MCLCHLPVLFIFLSFTHAQPPSCTGPDWAVRSITACTTLLCTQYQPWAISLPHAAPLTRHLYVVIATDLLLLKSPLNACLHPPSSRERFVVAKGLYRGVSVGYANRGQTSPCVNYAARSPVHRSIGMLLFCDTILPSARLHASTGTSALVHTAIEWSTTVGNLAHALTVWQVSLA